MAKELKTKYIQVKVTPQEQEILHKLAEEYGLTISAYLRMLIKKESKKLK